MLPLGHESSFQIEAISYYRSATSKWRALDDTLDPRLIDEEGSTGPIEDLVDLPIDNKEPFKVLKIGKNLSNEMRKVTQSS